jgi:hypothetical protein
MDSIHPAVIFAVVAVFTVFVLALVRAFAIDFGYADKFYIWRWKRALANDREKALSKLSTTARLIYIGIENCEDGNLPYALRDAYGSWNEYATRQEETALKYARREANKREINSKVMVEAVNGWMYEENEKQKAWVARAIVSSNSTLTGQLNLNTGHDDAPDAQLKQDTMKHWAQLQSRCKGL